MRRSSSTSIRCGASSASFRLRAARGQAVVHLVSLVSLAPERPPKHDLQHLVRIVVIDHGAQEAPHRLSACGIQSLERRRDAVGLQARELGDQRLALRRGEQQPLPLVALAGPLNDIVLVDQLLQHASKRLLGDPQHVQQVCHLQARIAMHKVYHSMMGAAEAELLQHLVGVADEIPVGVEQQLDDVPDRLARAGRCRLRAVWKVRWSFKFMSAILT